MMRQKSIDLILSANIKSWMQFLNRSQYWSVSETISYQNDKLQNIVNHAYYNIPFYKNLFNSYNLTNKDICLISDLKKLPVIRKHDVRSSFNKLKATNYKDYKPQKRSTGGTTGEPLIYYSDINTWSAHWALKYRAWTWGGYNLGDPIGLLGGASVIPDKKPNIKRKFWNILNNFYPLPATHLNDRIMRSYYEIIINNKIKHLRGYPSSIYTFAIFCRKNNLKVNFQSVITTAEVLQPIYKSAIREVFDCNIIDTYGCADGGGNANTCNHDVGFHISPEASIWEVCDKHGNPTKHGEIGELTLTSLTNFAMPLLRYQPGDLIRNTFNHSTCSCGRSLPRIDSIIGRTTDILRFSNGHSISGPALTLIFREFSLKNYQIIQNDPTSVTVNLVPDSKFLPEERENMVKIMHHHFGQDVNIIVNILEHISKPLSGKHRFIINNMQT